MRLIQEKTKNLANKESAKILVISDSHGQTRNLRSVLEAQKNTCDALVFTGDGIMDLITIMEEDFNSPPEHKILPQNVIFVRGNGDSPYYNFFTDKPQILQIPEYASFTVAHKKFFVTHGHFFGVYYSTQELLDYLEKNRFDAGLFGHTHVPFAKFSNDILLLNPGSIFLPRNNSQKSYAVLTVTKENIKYEFFEL